MAASNENSRKTPLFELHRQYGAKMVGFAGYLMPVNYRDGILKEHAHTREAAGLFDVSHMGQLVFSGKDAAAALERLLPVDLVGLGRDRQRYALITNEQGGIYDDLMVTNTGENLFLVVNARNKFSPVRICFWWSTPAARKKTWLISSRISTAIVK